MFDIKDVRKQAQEEFIKEKKANAVKKIKSKMRDLAAAELIVRNIKRELEDLEIELTM